jgi:hypothetical protein
MRSNIMTTRLVILTLLLAALTSQAWAGGPLILFDPATKTPYAYAGFVPVVTDLGNLGAVANANADVLVSNSAAQWSGVATSSFSAAVSGDFAAAGLPDITGANAALVIGVDNPGNGIFVIYDTDGTVTQNFLGAPPGVLGVASPEFAVPGSPQLTESWVVLNGSTIDPGDLPGAASWSGVITHEMGHSINLAHTQTNGGIIFFGDSTGPGGCTPPYGGGPSFATLETMFPFIDPSPGSTGVQQATIEHLDDTATLSDLYPAAGYPGNFGIIEGTVFATNGVSPLTGVNVIARNVVNPFFDAQSALSGDFTQGALGPDGSFRLTGLTPNADYVIYVDEIIQGGFSTSPLQPLGAPEEFWNATEANNNVADPPCDFTAVNVVSGQTVTTDIQLNSAAAPPVIGVSPGGFSFSIPTNTTDFGILNIQNVGGAGALDLNWNLEDVQPAIGLPVNGAWSLDPARVQIAGATRVAPSDSRDPVFQRACSDCGREHAARKTPIDLSAAAMAPGMINDGSFELGGFGGAWTEFSSNFGTPICDAGLCGTGGGTGPRTGTYWCWFGGIAATEIASVSQSVVLPATGSLSLEFYTELPACDSAADFMEVLVDGTPVYFVDGADAACGTIGYDLVSVDISAYADGGSHTIEFRSETYSVNTGVTNFFLDDVSLVEVLGDCPWLSASPLSGTTPQGGSSPVTVQVDATGLAPGIYVCELRIASNDPANPVVTVPVDLEVVANNEINAIVFPIQSLNGPVSLFALPNGAGDPLTAAQLWNGVPGVSPIPVDATIGVRLVDGIGNPVVGFPPELISVASLGGGWAQCAAFPLIADGPTDASGLTTISGTLFAGGHSGPGELMVVTVNDPLLASTSYPGGLPGLEYFVNSADILSDLLVNLTDIPDFAAIFFGGAYDYAADFEWDGVINLSDVTRLASGFPSACPAPPVAAADQDGVADVQASEVIGVVFDAAGTTSARMIEPGVQTDAYVVLSGPAAEQGIEAFDARIRVSSNVTVHQQNLVGQGLNIADGDDFVVGLAAPRNATASRPLQLVHLRVSVTDTRPAYFWIESSRLADQDLPTVVREGKLLSARPASGDVSRPVASLNDKDFAIDDNTTPSPRLSMRIAPNPFNPMTAIRFRLPADGPVELRVFDARGQLVTTLRSEVMAAGEHEVVWNGTDRSGRNVASGVYFSRLQTDAGTLLEKMMLMK